MLSRVYWRWKSANKTEAKCLEFAGRVLLVKDFKQLFGKQVELNPTFRKETVKVHIHVWCQGRKLDDVDVIKSNELLLIQRVPLVISKTIHVSSAVAETKTIPSPEAKAATARPSLSLPRKRLRYQSVMCGLCDNLPTYPMVTPCCTRLVCRECILQDLSFHDMCFECQRPLVEENLIKSK